MRYLDLNNVIPVIGFANRKYLDLTGVDTTGYQATASNGVTVTCSAPTYGSGYSLACVMNGLTTGTYWLTSSSGNQTLTFDFTPLGCITLSSILVSPYTRSDARSNYKIAYSEDGGNSYTYIHDEFVDTSNFSEGEYITEEIGKTVTHIRFDLTREGRWGCTLNDIRFLLSTLQSKYESYKFTPRLEESESCEQVNSEVAKLLKDNATIECFHKVMTGCTVSESHVVFDNLNGAVTVGVSVSYDGVSFPEPVAITSDSSLPFSVMDGTVLRFTLTTTLSEGSYVTLPLVSFKAPYNQLNCAKLEFPEPVSSIKLYTCDFLNQNRDRVRVLLGVGDSYGTLVDGSLKDIALGNIMRQGLTVDGLEEVMSNASSSGVIDNILIALDVSGEVYIDELDEIGYSSIFNGTMVEGVGCATSVAFTNDVSVIRNYVRVDNSANKVKPVQGNLLNCHVSTSKFTGTVSVIKNYRRITRANRNYSGVYFATGEREKMYQPRKYPLNWVPQKWNGQDM